MNQAVYIVGGGAIGKALAVFLANAGRNVKLLRSHASSSAINNQSITVELKDGPSLSATVSMGLLSEQQDFDGVIVLTSKSFGNSAIAATLPSNCPVVLLQNGLNIEHSFLENNLPNIFRCVLFATSQLHDEQTVRFKPVAPSPIGLIHGNATLLPEIVSLLSTPNFPFVAESNIRTIIWKKVIANCVFNSICPLLDIDNGIFHRNESALTLAKEVIAECIAVSQKAGIELDSQEVLQTVLQISKASDGQLISTLQDIRARRPTEIETLNFAVAQTAKELGMSDVVPKIKVLGELTQLKSQLAMTDNIHNIS